MIKYLLLVLISTSRSTEDKSSEVKPFPSPPCHHLIFGDGNEKCQTIDSTTCPVQEYCGVGLPQDSSIHCMTQREKEKSIAKMWYKLTVAGEKQTIGFPFTHMPWLNQTMHAVSMHAATDPDEVKWTSVSNLIFGTVQLLNKTVFEQMAATSFHSYQDYKTLYKVFNEAVRNLPAQQYYGNPVYNTPTQKRFIDDDFWLTDEFFVQKRLSGPCPFLLRRVTCNESDIGLLTTKLLPQLNKDFDFDIALSDAYGESITMRKAIMKARLYALYNAEHNGLPTLPDMTDPNPHDTRVLMNNTSPITLFIRNRNNELKVVAIQWDYQPESKVYTPKSPYIEWITAKAMVESADLNICQAIYHLSHVHFSSTLYCTVFRRHFSKLHPLYDVMKHHCEGMTPHISLSYPVLSFPFQAGHLVVGIGHLGFVNLSLTAFDQHHYGILDYDFLMESRGFDDRRISYYPFRDDGKIIWDELVNFSNEFVETFYVDDQSVFDDSELQSFANEMSIDGNISPDGGHGKIVGFPSSFTSRVELERFITSLLWINVFHVAVNYPVEPFHTFVPMGPSKIYEDPGAVLEDIAYSLPDGPASIGAASFAAVLGNLRINRIMDYHENVRDLKLRRLVKQSYDRFHTCIQATLEKRNNRRVSNSLLPFQYFEPKWLTNSVHV